MHKKYLFSVLSQKDGEMFCFDNCTDFTIKRGDDEFTVFDSFTLTELENKKFLHINSTTEKCSNSLINVDVVLSDEVILTDYGQIPIYTCSDNQELLTKNLGNENNGEVYIISVLQPDGSYIHGEHFILKSSDILFSIGDLELAKIAEKEGFLKIIKYENQNTDIMLCKHQIYIELLNGTEIKSVVCQGYELPYREEK